MTDGADEFDPGEYAIAELGPEIQSIEDIDELEAILERETDGRDRTGAKKLIESRIEKFSADDEDTDDGDLELAGMSAADIGNAVRSIDSIEELEALIERETDGENRDSVIGLIENRIESLTEDDEDAEADGEPAESLPPEEKYPELDHPTADKQYVSDLQGGTYRDMWVYCETQAGELIDVSLEMLGKARELMDGYNERYDADERVIAVVLGDDASEHADECIAYGADLVVYHEDDRLERFQHKPYTELFCAMARSDADWKMTSDLEEPYDEPRYTVFPATNNGRDLSALVQAELDSGLASDCSGLSIQETQVSNPVKTGAPGETKTFRRVLHMKRPDFSGFEYSTILCLDNPNRDFHPQGASVIPGSFEIPDPDADRTGETIAFETEPDDEWFRVTVEEYDRLEEGVDLTGHEVIVAVGRGINADPTKGVELAVELADAFDDANVGVTRGIVTGSYNFDGHVEQYTEEERQIGETGQVIEPDVYIAAGISGAVQHKVGCDESDTIVSINTDPEARIRDWSDYFIEGDLFEVLPGLIDAVEAGEIDAGAVADGGESA